MPFELPGKFYRGNIHTHSNVSDGKLDPGELCRRYKEAGYDFLAVTDHFIGEFDYPITDTTGMRDDTFTTILGAELHSGSLENGDLWHILAVGLPTDFVPSNSPGFVPVEDQETGPQIAKRARDAGAFVAVVHPEWSGLTLEDAKSIDVAHAVEIYNRGCEVACDRGGGAHTLDLLLSEGKRLNLSASDDAHFFDPDHFYGWVMVKAESNNPDLLLDALKRGDYYSSQGPELHNVVWGDNKVSVACSEVSSLIVQGRGCASTVVHGENLREVEIELSLLKTSPWMRLTVIDSHGKRAWTNPVWN
ncbi:MAG: CehA/McbA family metallohydrolase [Pseudomonadota bacterium]